MKKIVMTFCLVVLTLCLTGCGNSYIKKVDIDTVNKMIEEKQSFILEVMSATCSACEDFEPKLRDVTNEYQITVYQLDTAGIDTEKWNTFSTTYSVSSTPTTMFFTEGEELTVATRIDGSVSRDKIISKFKAMNYITEE